MTHVFSIEVMDSRWIEVVLLAQIADEAILCVRVESAHILLVRHGDHIVACERACPHEQADLSLGRVTKGRLVCPRHLASFDLNDGSISAGWPSRQLQRYPVRIADGRVWIEAAAIGRKD